MSKCVKRIFLIVADSFGIGAAKDAHLYGDEGTNTLRSIHRSGALNIPNLIKLGLGNIDGVTCLDKLSEPMGTVARLTEKSRGKDTTTGHWEMMGIVSEIPFPTYPDGFPAEVIHELERRIGVRVLCNKPYSGTDVIRDFGKEHMKSGRPIVYTSADSVLQIAAHEDIIPLPRLYEYCRIAREMLVGEHGVGRVIARPFIGSQGDFKRTSGRRDFSLKPPHATVLDQLKASGYDVISIGKIEDIFCGEGITEIIHTKNNAEGIAALLDVGKRDFTGLCFLNLVDFDMLYGHRQDAHGYAVAMSELDVALSEFMDGMRADDMLMITADHGCDPSDDSTDHTREDVPLIIYRRGIKSENLGTLRGFDCIGRLICESFALPHRMTRRQ